jgi:predicted dehydrogenase
MTHEVSRREFVADAGKLALGAMIVPRHVLGGAGHQAPSDALNVAVVGFGGMGSNNALVLAQTENIVAICDADFAYAERKMAERLRDRDGTASPQGSRLQDQFAKAARYDDFREMLARQKDIDAVVVATPDHLHAVVAKAAMDLGKHVYVQKPLCYSVHEARVLRATALANPKLVTQMGNQGHSGDGARLINEWIQAGIIGPVREVHVWTNRPLVYWPQGIPRPTTSLSDAGAPSPFDNPWSTQHVNDVLAAAMGGAPVPAGLRWDLYLGPVATDVLYHPIYHPFNWRGWIDFGVGALGDMGAHLIDQPFWALGLTYPTSIEATSTPWGTVPVPVEFASTSRSPTAATPRRQVVSYPAASMVHYQFPARGSQPPVRLTWYDGGLFPRRPDALPDDVPLTSEGGVIFVGDKGVLINDTYGANPRLYPASLLDRAVAVPQHYPRIAWTHELNWAKACKGQAAASSPIEYAAQLTETMLLGVVALRTGQGQRIDYDGEAMRITNVPEANQYLSRPYRSGWAI